MDSRSNLTIFPFIKVIRMSLTKLLDCLLNSGKNVSLKMTDICEYIKL